MISICLMKITSSIQTFSAIKMISKTLKIVFFCLILYASYLLFLLSIPYLQFNRGVGFLETKQFVYHIKSWRYGFYIHVFSSIFILIIGLFQFNTFVIKRKILHRCLGYSYIFLLLFVSGPAALILSFYANGGVLAQFSFAILSILWIGSTFLALYFAWKKKFELHGNFLIRSYALTLSAVTLRFYAYLFDKINLNLGPVDTYILISYLGWIPNLIVAEILIQRGFVKQLFLKSSKS